MTEKIVVYKCPRCGSTLRVLVLTIYPPIIRYYCENCGWSREERSEIVEVPRPLAVMRKSLFMHEKIDGKL